MNSSEINFGTAIHHSTDILAPTQDGLSLDERLINVYAQTSQEIKAEQRYVIDKLQKGPITSDPAELFNLQQMTSDYNLKVTLISALARKGVSAVETLLRS